MKKISVVSVLLCIGAAICLSGCENENTGTNSKLYTYENLDEKGKAVVDGVYNDYEYWKSHHDSGEDFLCTKVNFFYEDNKMVDDNLIFTTCYEISVDGFDIYEFYEVNQENGKLSGHNYDSLHNQGEKNVAIVKASSGYSFPGELDEDMCKDTLANAYENRSKN